MDRLSSYLEFIHFGSPGNVDIKIDFGIADILRVIIEGLQNIGLKRNRYRSETESIELNNEAKRIENTAKQIELLRSAINLAKDAQTDVVKDKVIERLLRNPLKQALGVERLPANLFEENSLERGILEERILPAAAELINSNDPSYEISVGDSP